MLTIASWDRSACRGTGCSITGTASRLTLAYRNYAAADDQAPAAGVRHASGRLELYSTLLAEQGSRPSPLRGARAERGRHHRGIARLRKAVPHSIAEIHPDTAAAFGIEDDTWMLIETPHGGARAKAKVMASRFPTPQYR